MVVVLTGYLYVFIADKNTGSHKLFSNLPFLLGLIFGLAALVFIPLSIWKLVTLYGEFLLLSVCL